MSLLIYFLPAIALLGASVVVWGTLIETRRFRVWNVKLPRKQTEKEEFPSLCRDSFPDLSILHITDTHFNGRDEVKLGFLREVVKQVPKPDFVFITGDILDIPPGLDSCLALAEMVESNLGSYAVLGGHDYFRNAELWRKYLSIYKNSPKPSLRRVPNPVIQLRNGFIDRGVNVLEDNNQLVELPGGGRIAVVGLNDVFFFRCDYDRAWAGVNGQPTIVIAHSPDVLPEVAERGADLAFFGHTHGGQIRLPFKGAIVTRSMVGAKRARGIFRERETVFTINQGLGATRGTHIRLCCPPEVTLLNTGGTEFSQNYVPYAEYNNPLLNTDQVYN